MYWRWTIRELCLPGFIAFAVEEFIMHGFAQLLAYKHVAHGEFIAVVVNGNNQCFFMIGKHRFMLCINTIDYSKGDD